jgi:hypothetical protein
MVTVTPARSAMIEAFVNSRLFSFFSSITFGFLLACGISCRRRHFA